jgi:hypothetical protein
LELRQRPREASTTLRAGDGADLDQVEAKSELGRALVVGDGRLAGLLSIPDLGCGAQLGGRRR